MRHSEYCREQQPTRNRTSIGDHPLAGTGDTRRPGNFQGPRDADPLMGDRHVAANTRPWIGGDGALGLMGKLGRARGRPPANSFRLITHRHHKPQQTTGTQPDRAHQREPPPNESPAEQQKGREPQPRPRLHLHETAGPGPAKVLRRIESRTRYTCPITHARRARAPGRSREKSTAPRHKARCHSSAQVATDPVKRQNSGESSGNLKDRAENGDAPT